MLRKVFPRRVAVGLVVAAVFVGVVVAAGYVFRDRGHSTPHRVTTTVPSSQGTTP